MKFLLTAAVVLLLPATASAQNPSQAVVSQYSGGGSESGSAIFSQGAPLLWNANSTPTMRRQAATRALSLREQVTLWIAADGGSLSMDHQRNAVEEIRAIRSLMGYGVYWR